MESSMRNELKVGIFALLGVLGFCVSVILLGGDKFFLSRSYNLKVKLPQVQGLGRGSVVTLAGLQVGNVRDINFIPNSSDVEVVMSIEYGVRERITEGSKVSVKTQGALGDKYLFIQPGPLGGAPLKEDSVIEADSTPDLIDMISSKGAELGEVVNIIKEVHTLFASMNKDGRSGKLMGNLVDGSDNFNKFMIEARETMRSMRSDAIVPMSSVMKKIDAGEGTLGALVNDPGLHNRLSSMLGVAPRNRFLKPLIRESIETNEKKK